jgi:hypothetical protein
MIKFTHPLELEPQLSLIKYDKINIKANITNSRGKTGFEQNLAFA